jgi:rhamnose transport system substrate-binding protein
MQGLGKLSGYATIALVNGDITGALDETFTAGDLGEYTITEADDGGTEIVLGLPLEFNSENIEEMAQLY